MRFMSRVAVAALCCSAVSPALAQSSDPALDRQFAAAVERVLRSVENPFFDTLSAAEMNAFVACAQAVMDVTPGARKRYVLEARGLDEQMQRFDEVAQENNAYLKQEITRRCA
jgi:hypothetical protein